MKRIILCLTALLLLFAACEKGCKIKYPKDVKPIDWENYNAVYDVFWNYITLCKEANEEDYGKDIMVCGWVFQGIEKNPFYNISRAFAIISDEEDIFFGNFSTNGTGFYVHPNYGDSNQNLIDSLKIKFDTTDITKKCFIKGKLSFDCLHTEKCSRAVPEIILEDINNINFE